MEARLTITCAVALLIAIASSRPSYAQQTWEVAEGTAALVLHPDRLDDYDVSVSTSLSGVSASNPFSQALVDVAGASDLTFTVDEGSVVEWFGRWIPCFSDRM